jgi:hypothetical protein
MYYVVIPSKKLIVGHNPKTGCGTIKATILKDLGFEYMQGYVQNQWHRKMVHAIANKEIPIYDLTYEKNNSIEGFTKVCVVRNPYERLISGIRHRFAKAVGDTHNLTIEYIKDMVKKSELTVNELVIHLQQNDFYPDKYHFQPQTVNLLEDIIFDRVYDISDMGLFISDHFPNQENKRYASNLKVHTTKYDDIDIDYTNMKIKDIIKEESFSPDPHHWFSAESIKIINELYKEDFEFCKKYGIEYKITKGIKNG